MHNHQASILCNIPPTILESIALEAALLDPLGPPVDIIPLLQTCHYINHVLCLKNCRHLYARIFRSMFDYRAASRRFGSRANYSSNLAVQLKKYCTTLKRIRRADLDSDTLTLDLWNAFFMAMENDGRNLIQLEWAGLKGFVEKFVRERLWHDREASHGWPAENTMNALALWLMWFTTDQDTINAELATPEGRQRREQLMDLVRPYVVTAVRYPAFHAPDNHFDFPLSPDLQREFPYSLITPHGFYPLYRQPSLLVERHTHYNMLLDIAPPPITIAAKLLYFSRSEAMEIQFPPQIPVDRATAMVIHQQQYPNERPFPSPTQADWREFNAHKGAKLVDKGKWDWRAVMSPEDGMLEDDGVWRKGLKATSAKWDNDWQRFTCCYDPWTLPPLKGVVYTYGTMYGQWQGRMLIPDISEYFGLVTSSTFPTTFSVENPRMTMLPIYFYLREHHCINPEYPVVTGGQHDGFDDGIRNGWFPSIELSEHSGVVKITDVEHSWVSKYETYVPEKPSSHSEETCSQCLRKKAEEEEELQYRRMRERERMERLSEERELQAIKDSEMAMRTKAKRKREGKEVEVEGELDERSRRKLMTMERREAEQLEESDALDHIPDFMLPRPRNAAAAAAAAAAKGNDNEESHDDECDTDNDAAVSPEDEPTPSSPSASSSRSPSPPQTSTPAAGPANHGESQHLCPHHSSHSQIPHSPSPSTSSKPSRREASLEEVRMTVDQAFGPENNVDDILDQVMAEGGDADTAAADADVPVDTNHNADRANDQAHHEHDDMEEGSEGESGSEDEEAAAGVTPNVTYDDGPEVFPEERESIEGMDTEDEDYQEFVENTCNGIQDIIITGETIPRHGQAFHHFRFYGRVRRWDGLIAVVRVPVEHPRLGISIFRGYVTANRNWVGSWRAFTNNVRAIPLEGPFIASRVD